jgi:hypothetical protein
MRRGQAPASGVERGPVREADHYNGHSHGDREQVPGNRRTCHGRTPHQSQPACRAKDSHLSAQSPDSSLVIIMG